MPISIIKVDFLLISGYKKSIDFAAICRKIAGALTENTYRPTGKCICLYEFIPPTNQKGNYLIQKDKAFGPDEPVWKYIAPDTISFWSNYISGAHRMKNGNTFIDEGGKGRFFEVTREGKIVWEYLNPYRGDIRRPNGDPIPPIRTFSTFRSTFIPADHPALANRRLEPLNPQPKVFILPSPPTANRNNRFEWQKFHPIQSHP